MPTISWFYGIAIRMFYNDHAPPHFHAFTDEGEARIAIADGRLISGRLGRRQQELVRAWTLENRAALMDNWERARTHRALERIPGHANDD